MMGRLALLLGLFAVPVFLLWAGHHWRHRSARIRGAFWGGLIAHTLAALVASVAGMYRPAEWAASDAWRGFFGFWSMLVFFLIGATLGALMSSEDAPKPTVTPRDASRLPSQPREPSPARRRP